MVADMYTLCILLIPVSHLPQLFRKAGQMRLFWTLFFIGAMVAVGLDVHERRQSSASMETPFMEMSLEGDPGGMPTPRP